MKYIISTTDGSYNGGETLVKARARVTKLFGRKHKLEHNQTSDDFEVERYSVLEDGEEQIVSLLTNELRQEPACPSGHTHQWVNADEHGATCSRCTVIQSYHPYGSPTYYRAHEEDEECDEYE
jgi:hypothetical protein